MTARPSPTLAGLQNRTLANGGLPAETQRLGYAGLITPGANLHSRSGILPGPVGYRGVVALLSNTQATIEPFRANIPGTQSPLQGDYPVVNDASTTVAIGVQAASTRRIDLLVTYVRDTAYTPNEGVNDVVGPVVIPGTPHATTPVAPTTPPNALVHGSFTVPPTGQAVTFTPAVYAAPVALGGIEPVPNGDATAGRYGGQARWSPAGGLELWDGSGAWNGASGYRGSGPFYPSTAVQGDTFRHTGLGCLMRWDGSGWRQAELAYVATPAARTAMSAAYAAIIPSGFRVHVLDRAEEWEWSAPTGAAVSGWALVGAYGLPQGTIATSGVSTIANGEALASPHVQTRVEANVQAGRLYTVTIQDTGTVGGGATFRQVGLMGGISPSGGTGMVAIGTTGQWSGVNSTTATFRTTVDAMVAFALRTTSGNIGYVGITGTIVDLGPNSYGTNASATVQATY